MGYDARPTNESGRTIFSSDHDHYRQLPFQTCWPQRVNSGKQREFTGMKGSIVRLSLIRRSGHHDFFAPTWRHITSTGHSFAVEGNLNVTHNSRGAGSVRFDSHCCCAADARPIRAPTHRRLDTAAWLLRPPSADLVRFGTGGAGRKSNKRGAGAEAQALFPMGDRGARSPTLGQPKAAQRNERVSRQAGFRMQASAGRRLRASPRRRAAVYCSGRRKRCDDLARTRSFQRPPPCAKLKTGRGSWRATSHSIEKLCESFYSSNIRNRPVTSSADTSHTRSSMLRRQ